MTVCRNAQTEFLRQYGQAAEQLYKIAVLITGDAGTAVRAVENAAVRCYRDFPQGDFANRMYSALWQECEGAACAVGDDYCRAVCKSRGLSDDSTPALIRTLSRCGSRERAALSLLLLAGMTPAQTAAILGTEPERINLAVQKLCGQMQPG